ncbi:hypothetical protein LEP1GSC185_3534 [Leptospira licerasiae serovar Varillal str. VAR 010]|uniref:DUF1564 family protein n=1 Tax=Leptospira licerasiae str. MMD4847 TaxID=1049971 RepID=A0ABN0HE33_9LEPT|nr:hypothetical protein LEP1GSC185_3534 [Leptospira licerasiae serovar Varillal str. VAR 010]EJZ43876.1 hypothetical protein LEP1GSC178_2012 [Leptospira licerasiae str. MMD4847]
MDRYATTHSGFATFCIVTALAWQARSNAKRRNTLVVRRTSDKFFLFYFRVKYSLERAVQNFPYVSPLLRCSGAELWNSILLIKLQFGDSNWSRIRSGDLASESSILPKRQFTEVQKYKYFECTVFGSDVGLTFGASAALRARFATLAWPSAHFALSLALQSKSRAKSFGLAKRRNTLVVRRKALNTFDVRDL